MKIVRRPRSARPTPTGQLAGVRARLAEAHETLRAIREGEVDALVATGKAGPGVYTLQGADHAYRVLIESMNEGAVTLTPDGVILYANQCFARLVASPLEQVIGAPLLHFLPAADQPALAPLLERVPGSGSKSELVLQTGDGARVPVRISIRPLASNNGDSGALCLVVTDMTEARRNEEMLRNLTNRLVQAQESERGRVANDLRVNITQLLNVILGRCQTLAEKLPAGDSSSLGETVKIKEILGRTAKEVEHLWRSLWSYDLEKLGLVPALKAANADFGERTGVSVQMDCSPLTAQLPAKAELALYRILQKTLSNVEHYACARHVTVHLTQPGAFIQLTIKDDGIGFDPDHPVQGKENNGFGLARMRERAAYLGGLLTVKSAPGAGTEIEVRIPLLPSAPTTN